MKTCPVCRAEYFDNTLEFCLQDGSRLDQIAGSVKQTTFAQTAPTAEPTLFMPSHAGEAETVARAAKDLNKTAKENDLTSVVESKFSKNKSLTYLPLISALAHNWWQWVYLEKQYYSNFTSYVFSANFLMWLVLLTVALISAFLSFRYSRAKNNTYLGLIILAINLLLFIVPRR